MDTLAHLPRAQSYDGALHRKPAIPGYIGRKLNQLLNPPVVGSREHLVEICRAEIEWSFWDWKALTKFNGYNHEGQQQSEAHRLPHEHAAARLVNCSNHLVSDEGLSRELLSKIKGQRRAAARMDQSWAYRASWQAALDGSLRDWAETKPRLRRALVAFMAAAKEYRALRAEIDSPTGAPCLKNAA